MQRTVAREGWKGKERRMGIGCRRTLEWASLFRASMEGKVVKGGTLGKEDAPKTKGKRKRQNGKEQPHPTKIQRGGLEKKPSNDLV